MKVSLDSFNYVQATSYFSPAEATAWYKHSRTYETIVIHWWGNPTNNPTFEGIVSYFSNPNTQTSPHFVVSDTRITQMVNMGDVAFHAMSANPISVGIEVDPNTPGRTIETVGALVRFIREYLGCDMYLSPHSKWVNTSCPGTIDINKIEAWSRNENLVSISPVVVVPIVSINYRVKDLSGTQLGAYTKQESAWNKYIAINRQGSIVDANGTDVTKDFTNKFEPPIIIPTVPVVPIDIPVVPPLASEPPKTAVDLDQDKRLTALEKLVKIITDFLSSIFNGFNK